MRIDRPGGSGADHHHPRRASRHRLGPELTSPTPGTTVHRPGATPLEWWTVGYTGVQVSKTVASRIVRIPASDVGVRAVNLYGVTPLLDWNRNCSHAVIIVITSMWISVIAPNYSAKRVLQFGPLACHSGPVHIRGKGTLSSNKNHY